MTESVLQNNPDGDVVPPRKGMPLMILVEATLFALESADVQLLKLPAEQF